MKPYDHAELSVSKFGGKYEDYIEIHKWFDQFRYAVGDIRHRLFLHNTVGVMICEQVFGDFLENSDGKKIAIRDIAEHHIFTDVGEIRTPQDWLNNLHDNNYLKPYPAKLDKLPEEDIKIPHTPFSEKDVDIFKKLVVKPFKKQTYPFDDSPKIFD